MMAETKRRVCQAATERLLAKNGKAEVLRDLSVTPEVLKRGASLLLGATIEAEGLSVYFDGLKRTAGSPLSASHHYMPVLFDAGEKPGRLQKALLELLGLVLGSVQGRKPGWGMLIYG
jgi:hypothetical protein